jgi:hypothetical protein
MELKKLRFSSEEWIYLAHGQVQMRAVMNIITNLCVREFLKELRVH